MFALSDVDECVWKPGTTYMCFDVWLSDGRVGQALWPVVAPKAPSREDVLAQLNALVERDGEHAVIARLASPDGLSLAGLSLLVA